MTTETFEPADFRDFKPGDRIHFVTKDNGYGGSGDHVWRTGTVTRVTEKTIAVDCDSNWFGNRAVLRRATFNGRAAQKADAVPDVTQELLAAQASGQEIVCNSSLYSDQGRRLVHTPRCSVDSQPWVPVFDQFDPHAHRYASSDCVARTLRTST